MPITSTKQCKPASQSKIRDTLRQIQTELEHPSEEPPQLQFITLDTEDKKLYLCSDLSLHQRDLFVPSRRTGTRLNPIIYHFLQQQEAEYVMRSGCGCAFASYQATPKSGCHLCSETASSGACPLK